MKCILTLFLLVFCSAAMAQKKQEISLDSSLKNHDSAVARYIRRMEVLEERAKYDTINKGFLKPSAYTRFDSARGVYMMPFDAMDTVYGGIRKEPGPYRKRTGEEIDVWWPEILIDGTMDIVINTGQVYIVSGHDNPNPNYLYWIDTLSVIQFRAIEKSLAVNFKKYRVYYDTASYSAGYYFERNQKIPDEWNDKTSMACQRQMESYTWNRLGNIFMGANVFLKRKDKIRIPSQRELFRNSVHVCNDPYCWHMPVPVSE